MDAHLRATRIPCTQRQATSITRTVILKVISDFFTFLFFGNSVSDKNQARWTIYSVMLAHGSANVLWPRAEEVRLRQVLELTTQTRPGM